LSLKYKQGSTLSLFLIDEHPVVGLGLSHALQANRRFRLAGTATSPEQGLRMMETLHPDAVIVELVHEGETVTGMIGKCRRLLPDVLLVVFSSLPKRLYEREALEMGADAYVEKNNDVSVLIATLTHMAGGQRGGSRLHGSRPDPSDMIIDGAHLTRREAEIARRLGAGHSVARIAADLAISANTVSVHRDNLRKKLNCRDMVELVARLARHGRLDPDLTRKP
jgi:two-component system NarL family response regulator